MNVNPYRRRLLPIIGHWYPYIHLPQLRRSFLNKCTRVQLRDLDGGGLLDNQLQDKFRVVYHALFLRLAAWAAALPFLDVLPECLFPVAPPSTNWIVATIALW